ncbi:hypothetical protein BgiBS90_027223, partial [Biomphalaria glabrata]
ITIYDNNVINIEGDLKIDNESKNLIIGKTKIQIDKIKEMKKFQTVYKSLKESDFRTYSNFAIVIKKRIGPFIIEGQPVITGFLSLTKFALGCEKHSVSAFILYLYALLATFRKKHDVCLKSIVEKKTLPENCKFCIEAKIKMDDPSQSQSSGVTELPIITFDLKMNDTELEFQESNGSIYLKIKKCILYMMKDGKVCVDKNVLVHFMSHTYMKIVEEVLIILLFIVTVVLVISFLGSNYYITVTNQMFITLVFSLLPSLVKLVKENKLKDNKLNEIDLEHEMQNSFQENFNSYSFDVVVEDILISTNEDTTGSTNDRRNSQIHAINNQRTDLNINSETTYLLSS